MDSDSRDEKRQGADDLAHADPWDANREVVTGALPALRRSQVIRVRIAERESLAA